MKLSLVAAAVVLLPIAFSSQATETKSFQSFSSVNYSNSDYNYGDAFNVGIASQYFFDGRITKGPLNEFDYINTLSNISVDYQYTSAEHSRKMSLPYNNQSVEMFLVQFENEIESNNVNISADWFVGDFLLGGTYGYSDYDGTWKTALLEGDAPDNWDEDYSKMSDSDSAYSLSLGYLISDNFLVKSTYHQTAELFTFMASYDLTLNDTDYIGFSYETDENFDVHALSSKYFMLLANDSYLTVSAAYTVDNMDDDYFDEDNYWSVGSSYYFNQYTSISANYDENENYSLAATHFFNDNYSLSAGYTSTNDSDDDFKSYGISFSAQF